MIVKHPSTNALLFLVHLMQNSLLVSEGDIVKRGQPIGKVGNSGSTTEPHLHIHSTMNGIEEPYTKGKRIPLVFNGRFLIRNSMVKCK